ncbi:hypothetical protein GCM10012275_42610 [Longimycelium tulufanense]|uniref:Uncharacterized protein n=1 Tax=Longimycelium tulufanense TaxID=907463 RepID=A0A8J3CFE2_9PSEU|nr:hypothetical protein [Longimycelium tulufanense]GGM67493.1 hypothetical protein GCM10012275_42610 [Longimycelium tulufanense]
MSRHYLTPTDRTTFDHIVVGWDRPLGSFFADAVPVSTTPKGEEIVEELIGLTDRVTDPQTVIDVVAPYAQIPTDLASTLADEVRRSPLATIDEHNRVQTW